MLTVQRNPPKSGQCIRVWECRDKIQADTLAFHPTLPTQVYLLESETWVNLPESALQPIPKVRENIHYIIAGEI